MKPGSMWPEHFGQTIGCVMLKTSFWSETARRPLLVSAYFLETLRNRRLTPLLGELQLRCDPHRLLAAASCRTISARRTARVENSANDMVIRLSAPVRVLVSSAPQALSFRWTHAAETLHGSPAEATIVESSSFHSLSVISSGQIHRLTVLRAEEVDVFQQLAQAVLKLVQLEGARIRVTAIRATEQGGSPLLQLLLDVANFPPPAAQRIGFFVFLAHATLTRPT
jgi:hypothetical protein